MHACYRYFLGDLWRIVGRSKDGAPEKQVAEAELRLGEAIASRAGNLKAVEVRFCFHLVRIMVTFDQSSLLTITFDQFSFRFVISTCPSAQI